MQFSALVNLSYRQSLLMILSILIAVQLAEPAAHVGHSTWLERHEDVPHRMSDDSPNEPHLFKASKLKGEH